MRFARRIILPAIWMVMSMGAAAQNPRGSLTGIVSDANGGRVASAKVTVTASGSKVERTATSDSRGEFRLDDLAPGEYRVTVNAPGLAEAESDVTIAVSSVREITVTM